VRTQIEAHPASLSTAENRTICGERCPPTGKMRWTSLISSSREMASRSVRRPLVCFRNCCPQLLALFLIKSGKRRGSALLPTAFVSSFSPDAGLGWHSAVPTRPAGLPDVWNSSSALLVCWRSSKFLLMNVQLFRFRISKVIFTRSEFPFNPEETEEGELVVRPLDGWDPSNPD